MSSLLFSELLELIQEVDFIEDSTILKISDIPVEFNTCNRRGLTLLSTYYDKESGTIQIDIGE